MENMNLKNLQKFFKADKLIKKELYNLCPPKDVGPASDYSIIEYCEKTNIKIQDILDVLKSLYNLFIGSYYDKKIDEIRLKIINELSNCESDINKLKLFYEKNISNMKLEFLNKVKKECVGYSMFSSINGSIQMVETVNELLHLLHSYIVNNENFYQGTDKINSKINDFKYPIVLHGVEDEFSLNLFSNFPVEMDCGWTDIVSLGNDSCIIMVRDRGHALTIEISKVADNYRIEYFIPKLCNVEMINKLPGINKVNSNAPGATGKFEVPEQELYNRLFDFISKVPMDSDIVLDMVI